MREHCFKEMIRKESIPVPFDKITVNKAIYFMEHEHDTTSSKHRMPNRLPTPLPQNRKLESLIPDWYGKFLRDNAPTFEDLQELYECASFLECKPLMLLCSAKLASLLQSTRSIAQMRDLLNVKSDYSVDEEL